MHVLGYRPDVKDRGTLRLQSDSLTPDLIPVLAVVEHLPAQNLVGLVGLRVDNQHPLPVELLLDLCKRQYICHDRPPLCDPLYSITSAAGFGRGRPDRLTARGQIRKLAAGISNYLKPP